MTPIRVADLGVEPVSLTEMRGYLRLDDDESGEDALITGLITAARASIEAATRRLVRPARYRLMLTAWPAGGVLPLPLSPLLSVVRAGIVGADAVVEEID
ncbi:head-tail connector protein, partial [Methylobacterium gnaphalii]